MSISQIGRGPVARGLGSLAVALLLAFSLAIPSARAAEVQGPEGARQFLQSFGDQAVAALSAGSQSQEQRTEAFRGLIRSGFEIGTIGRLVLGRHWKRASEDQRAEFKQLFEAYVVVTTVRRLSDYSGEVLKVGAARPSAKNGLVTVRSSIARKAGSAIVLDWRLRHGDGGWRVIDVVVEGVSMLQTQRAEFDAVIRNSGQGLDGLLDRLRVMVQA